MQAQKVEVASTVVKVEAGYMSIKLKVRLQAEMQKMVIAEMVQSLREVEHMAQQVVGMPEVVVVVQFGVEVGVGVA